MLKKSIQIGVMLLILILVAGEVVGRYYGLRSFPLFQASSAYEYIHVANQKVRIYGNRYETNEFSMRSKAVLDSDTTIILLIGDSIVNGGNLTDQDSLASTILENRLSRYFSRRIRVLNIATGSWGPDNAAAYLKEKGTFNADLILLVFSSADAFDTMDHEPKVGVNIQYPDKQAFFAWEVILKKAWPRVMGDFSFTKDKQPVKQEEIVKTEKDLNPGFQDFRILRDTTAIPMHFYLHAGMKEIASNKLDEEGNLIVSFCQKNHIPYSVELEKGVNASYYMDKIHFNNQGQKFLADNLFPIIINELGEEAVLTYSKN